MGPAAALITVTINGRDAASDTLTVDVNRFPGLFTGTVVFDGGADGNDVLRIIDGGPTTFASVVHNIIDANSGNIQFDDDGPGGNSSFVIQYSDLEPVTQTITVTDVTLNFSNADDVITVTDSGTPGQTIVDSDNSESFTFTNPTNSLTINAGDGNDTLTVTSFGSGFDASLRIDGQGSATGDTIAFNAAGFSLTGTNAVDFDAETININQSITTDTGGIDLNGSAALNFAGNLSTNSGTVALTAGATGLSMYQETVRYTLCRVSPHGYLPK